MSTCQCFSTDFCCTQHTQYKATDESSPGGTEPSEAGAAGDSVPVQEPVQYSAHAKSVSNVLSSNQSVM